MKPTEQGIVYDLGRLKSRISRAYAKGELTKDEMQQLAEKIEEICTLSKKFLGTEGEETVA